MTAEQEIITLEDDDEIIEIEDDDNGGEGEEEEVSGAISNAVEFNAPRLHPALILSCPEVLTRPNKSEQNACRKVWMTL